MRGRAGLAALAFFALSALLAPLRATAAPESPGAAPWANVQRVGGVPCIAAHDLARLLGATQFWRADVRKLVLRAGAHRFTLTADDPFVLIDDRTERLDPPARTRGGEMQVPIAFLALLPRDSTLAHVSVDPGSGRVRVAPPGGVVGQPVVHEDAALARIVLPAEQAEGAVVVSRGRAHFLLRVPGVFEGSRRDSLASGALLAALRVSVTGGSTLLEATLTSEVAGFRLLRDAQAQRVTLEFPRTGSALERFAPAASGPRALRVIVLDPGHGGDDAGVTVDDAVEKTLTLALARLVAAELSRRTTARIVLTRTDDRALSPEQRAETANRARADVVLSLHFDGLAGSRARGATAWCPPALFAEGTSERGPGGLAPLTLTPWRDVATRHAADSRALADAMAATFETHGLGPALVRERLPVPLLGVDAPGLMLECATLTSPEDRARVTSDEGLRALAAGIADGLLGYARP